MKLRYKSLVARRARYAISDCLVVNVILAEQLLIWVVALAQLNVYKLYHFSGQY